MVPPSNKQHKSKHLRYQPFKSLSRAFQEPFKRIKMSSNMTVDQLLAERERIDAAINTMGGAKKQEKNQKRKSAPAGPWAAWTKKVLEENKEAVEAFKSTQEQKLGAHLKWISANKGKDSAEYKAFAEAFVPVAAPAPEEEAEPVVSSASTAEPSAAPKRRGPKKLADMTPEEKVAHDAKVAERKAKKEAEKLATEVTGKAAEEAPVAVPAPVAVVPTAAPEEAELELLPFKLDGVSYFRLGAKTADGEIAWEGDLWYNKKGVRGSYVGSLLEDGSIDTDAEEPTIE